MHESPRFAVVIPLFNKARYIRRALQSVVQQTFRDFEVIVVDDGSTDGSGDIVRSFSDVRVRLLSQPNQGESVARNNGIASAAAPLIAFLDADDEWLPGHLQSFVDLSNAFPECGAYATAYQIVRGNNRTEKPRYDGLPGPPWKGVMPNYFRSAQSRPSPVWSSAVAAWRNVLDESGGFPAGKVHGPDLYVWLQIALRYRIAFDSEPSAIYHKDADNRVMRASRSGDADGPRGSGRNGIVDFLTRAMAAETPPLAGVSRRDLNRYRNFLIVRSARRSLYLGAPARARLQLRGLRPAGGLMPTAAALYVSSLLPGGPQRFLVRLFRSRLAAIGAIFRRARAS